MKRIVSTFSFTGFYGFHGYVLKQYLIKTRTREGKFIINLGKRVRGGKIQNQTLGSYQKSVLFKMHSLQGLFFTNLSGPFCFPACA